MIGVGRPGPIAHVDQDDDIGGAVRKTMHRVRYHRLAVPESAAGQFDQRESQIDKETDPGDTSDFP